MSRNKAHNHRSPQDVARDEEVCRVIRGALGSLPGDQARLQVEVRRGGVLTLRGELPSELYLGPIADFVRSIPHVRELDARLRVA